MHLAESIPYRNHKLYVDNWFTSISLFKHLATRGIWCSGTVQPNRLYGLCFKANKLLLMKGWGTHKEQKTVSDNITLTAVKWIDTRSVCLLSSFLQASPLEKCKRFDKKKKTNVEINQPKCIKLYNKNMGEVDLADQLIALYRISFHVRKYYHKLMFHLLDMSIANAWLLYRRDAKKLLLSINKQQSLLQFKISIVDSLLKVGKCDYKKRGRKSDNEENFQKKKKMSNATHPIP